MQSFLNNDVMDALEKERTKRHSKFRLNRFELLLKKVFGIAIKEKRCQKKDMVIYSQPGVVIKEKKRMRNK